MMDKKILFAVTSNGKKGDTGESTGYYLSEVAHPWNVLHRAGYDIDFISPKGGKPPVEAVDLDDPLNAAFWNDEAGRARVERSRRPDEIDSDDYAALFFAGGHGTMWDFPGNPELAKLILAFHGEDKVIAAVCHGPSALADVKLENGRYLVEGKRINAFTDDEERAVGMDKIVPFLLESRLIERGARFEKSGLWQPHVAVDGRLITGQNPQSATGVGEAMLRLLREGASL